MIEIPEPRRVLSGAGVANLDFVSDSAMPGMPEAHGHITGSVTGVTLGGSTTCTIQVDRYGDGSVDGSVEADANGSFSFETYAAFNANLFKLQVIVSDGMAMTMTPGDYWQDYAFNVTPPANQRPAVTNLSFTVESNSSGMVSGRLEGNVADDGSSSYYEIQIDRNNDGSPDEWDSAFESPLFHFDHASMWAVVGSNTVKVRAVESNAVTGMPLEGDWVALTFNVDPPPVNEPPIVQELHFDITSVANSYAAGNLTGTVVDPDASATEYTIEVDLDDNGYADDCLVVGPSGSAFTIPLTNLEVNWTVFRVRAVEATSSGSIEGLWSTLALPLPNNAAPTLGNFSIEQAPARQGDLGRSVKIWGNVIDDGVIFSNYDVEFDFDSDGNVDATDVTGSFGGNGNPAVIAWNTNTQFPVGMNTILVRAVETGMGQNQLDSGWQPYTFEVTNAAPSFPQASFVVPISFTGSEAGDVPIADDPDQTLPPFVRFMDELKYTCNAPGISIDSAAHVFHIDDEPAFRRAMGNGTAFTLTATDPFGKTGTTHVIFHLVAGSTIIGSVKAKPQLIETIIPVWGGAPAVVTNVLGGVTLTVSHDTEAGTGSTLKFNRNTVTSVVRPSSTSPIPGHPDWEVRYLVAPGVGRPGFITVGPPVTTLDGQNQTITVSSVETVDIIDNSLLGRGALVARIIFTMSVTIQTDGTVTSGVVLNGFVAAPAYASFRNLNGTTSVLGGNAVLAP